MRKAILGLFAIWVLAAPSLIFAQVPKEEPRSPQSAEFIVPPELRLRVYFWIDVLARYGKAQEIFHHREYPEIVYSVVDFSDLAMDPPNRVAEKKRSEREKKEKERIKRALENLADTGSPQNDFERKIKQSFKETIGDKRRNYELAANEDSIRSQTGIREKTKQALINSSRYLYAMEKIFSDAGLPLELARIPFIESSFDYTARSSVGASGIWQFVRTTGRQYMRINAAIDERLDPIIATRAAAQYLAHAYDRLDAWPLAVTSYNHGISGMARASNQTGSRDIAKIINEYKADSFGFASKNFFVELLAAIEIEKHWKTYFPNVSREAPWRFDEVQLSHAVFFRDLVRASGAPVEDLIRLNPALLKSSLQNWTKVPAGFMFKTPRGSGQLLASRLKQGNVLSLESATAQFSAAVQDKTKKSADEQRYRVVRGDTISSIAKKLKVSRSDLMSVNGIRDPHRIKVGQTLAVPQ